MEQELKQKQIEVEELAKDIDYAINNKCKLNNGKSCEDCVYDNNGDWKCQNMMVATHLYGENYRKIPENAVVLTGEEREEFNELYRSALQRAEKWEKLCGIKIKETRKETAEKFAERLKEKYADYSDCDNIYFDRLRADIDEIAKEFMGDKV